MESSCPGCGQKIVFATSEESVIPTHRVDLADKTSTSCEYSDRNVLEVIDEVIATTQTTTHNDAGRTGD
jgi:hypothetical protein